MFIALTIFWLLSPLIATNLRCINGGFWVARNCTSNAQCEPYKPKSKDRVACLGSQCCTVPCWNNGTFTGKTCGTSYDCLPSKDSVACLEGVCCTVPQTCPQNGIVVGLDCSSDTSCQCLAPGVQVACLDRVCCAYPYYPYRHFKRFFR